MQVELKPHKADLGPVTNASQDMWKLRIWNMACRWAVFIQGQVCFIRHVIEHLPLLLLRWSIALVVCSVCMSVCPETLTNPHSRHRTAGFLLMTSMLLSQLSSFLREFDHDLPWLFLKRMKRGENALNKHYEFSSLNVPREKQLHSTHEITYEDRSHVVCFPRVLRGTEYERRWKSRDKFSFSLADREFYRDNIHSICSDVMQSIGYVMLLGEIRERQTDWRSQDKDICILLRRTVALPGVPLRKQEFAFSVIGVLGQADF